MLQFIVEENEKYSVPELIQMAIEGGCGWVQMHLPDMTDAEIRELAAEVIPLCKETSTILTIENHLDLAKELGLHGVHLIGDTIKPYDAREVLGPEAIIGVEVRLAASVLPLPAHDIDYATFAPMPLDQLAENVKAVRDAQVEIPLVAHCNSELTKIPEIMSTGVSGLAVGSLISASHDPVDTTAGILALLKPSNG